MKRVHLPHAAAGPMRLEGPRFHHLVRVLRIRAGEALEVFDGRGTVFSAQVDEVGTEAASLDGQGRMTDMLDLLAPFGDGSAVGPDLRRPRPLLRIVPGKCSGEPHVQETRLTTLTLAALFDRGYDLEGVALLYPDEPREALLQALDLERHLGSAA